MTRRVVGTQASKHALTDSERLWPGLTEAQRRVLTAAINGGAGSSVSNLCKTAGVSRVAYYYWHKHDSAFREAWQAIWLDQIRASLPRIADAQIRRAEKGDTTAARLLLEAAGLIKHGSSVQLLDQSQHLEIRLHWPDQQQQQPASSESPESPESGDYPALSLPAADTY